MLEAWLDSGVVSRGRISLEMLHRETEEVRASNPTSSSGSALVLTWRLVRITVVPIRSSEEDGMDEGHRLSGVLVDVRYTMAFLANTSTQQFCGVPRARFLY